ncbi:MAG: SPFH domain-containing protein [Fibromonadales bacterium]|nr:SPFH domain-containing protein [Fibromonadales bacterium]
MAIIDLVSWQPQSEEHIYAYKFPHQNLSTYTQLIVHESQEAVLFSKGKMIAKFGPGKHTLDTENIPVLRSLFGIPFGGQNPFFAEVWFVNKTEPYDLNWEVNRININDAVYNYMPLIAYGQYGLKIEDAEKFLVKLVGTDTIFTKDDLTKHFAGEFATKVKSLVVSFMSQQKISFMDIQGHLDEMSEHLKQRTFAFWAEFGFNLKKFYVSSIEIDETTEDGRKIKNAISEQQTQRIMGKTWQQDQAFKTANNAINQIGGGSGSGDTSILGAMMAMSMMGGMGGGAGGAMGAGMMAPAYGQPAFGASPTGAQPVPGQQGTATMPAVKMIYCDKCSKKFPSSMKFCPNCGDSYNPCPNCGTDNDPKSKRCISCGMALAEFSAPAGGGSNCSRCGTEIPGNSKFCPVCGQKRQG